MIKELYQLQTHHLYGLDTLILLRIISHARIATTKFMCFIKKNGMKYAGYLIKNTVF